MKKDSEAAQPGVLVRVRFGGQRVSGVIWARTDTSLWFYEVNVLRADDNVNRLIISKAFINAGKFRAEDFNQLGLDHQTVHDVALADEVGNECVFRLVVDLFRGTPSAGYNPGS